jgi:uncharacterized protein YjbI with pentapeptide repeats
LPFANLRGANLSGSFFYDANLHEADLRDANLDRAIFAEAGMFRADLKGASVDQTIFAGSNLNFADLEGLAEADLTGADLSGATLSEANVSRATMKHAILRGEAFQGTVMVHRDLQGADLSGSRVYGVSAWDVVVDEETIQADLIITPDHEPQISVDNIKVAQFIYLLLSNAELREVIETITSRAVLILGSFSPARKLILDAVRSSLRGVVSSL